jgi:2-polyprenyl-3-methyl-5-hydroxy-6-metoxy-1,4-benzoquinol methylase
MQHLPHIEAMKVFDVGCGRGEITKHLSGLGHEVLATDYSQAAARLFQQNVPGGTFLLRDATLGFPWIASDYFDLVVLADVVEHLYDEHLCVLAREAVRMLKPGGMILIDTPIMKGGESKLHVDIKESAQEVHAYFTGTQMIGTHWHKKPEHCNIILRKQ